MSQYQTITNYLVTPTPNRFTDLQTMLVKSSAFLFAHLSSVESKYVGPAGTGKLPIFLAVSATVKAGSFGKFYEKSYSKIVLYHLLITVSGILLKVSAAITSLSMTASSAYLLYVQGI